MLSINNIDSITPDEVQQVEPSDKNGDWIFFYKSVIHINNINFREL